MLEVLQPVHVSIHCTSFCSHGILAHIHVFSFIFFPFLLAIIPGFLIFHHFLLISFYSHLSSSHFFLSASTPVALLSVCDLLLPTTNAHSLVHRHTEGEYQKKTRSPWDRFWRLVPADLATGISRAHGSSIFEVKVLSCDPAATSV